MSKGNGPTERVKLKRADGEALPYTRFNGERDSAPRVTIAAIFDRGDGRKGFVPEADLEAAIRKAYGIPADVKLYLDIYSADDARVAGVGGKAKGTSKPGNDW